MAVVEGLSAASTRPEEWASTVLGLSGVCDSGLSSGPAERRMTTATTTRTTTATTPASSVARREAAGLCSGTPRPSHGCEYRRMDDLPTTAFVNAAVFDGHRYLGPVDGAVVVRTGGSRDRRAARRRRGRRRRRWAARAGVRRRARARRAGRARADPVQPRRGPHARGVPGDHRGVRRHATRTSRGSSAVAGRWPPSRAARRPRPTSTRSCRPAGLPAQPRPPRRLGQHPGAGDRRHHAATARSRRTAATSATPTASRPAPCTRARWTWSRARCRGHRRAVLRRPARRPGVPALARRHRLAGRDRRATTAAWTTPVRRTSRPRSAAT